MTVEQAAQCMLDAYGKWNGNHPGGEDDLHHAAKMLIEALKNYPAPKCEPLGDADWHCSACGIAMTGTEPSTSWCPECDDPE